MCKKQNAWKKESKSWGNWEAIQILKHADHCEVCFWGFVGFVYVLIEQDKHRLCHVVQQYSPLRGIRDILSEEIVLWWRNQKLLKKILFFPLSKYENFWCFMFLNQCLLHWLLQRMKRGLRGRTVMYSTVCISTYHGNDVSWSLLQSSGCFLSIHSHFTHQLRQAYPFIHIKNIFFFIKVFICVDQFVVFSMKQIKNNKLRFQRQLKLQVWTWDTLNRDVKMTWNKHLLMLSARADSVMPSTGCILCHPFRRELSIQPQWGINELISLLFFSSCGLLKTHLPADQASPHTLEALSVPLSVIYPRFNGAQSLLERRTGTN